ncbi:MAG TPA: hypothetical protein VK503_11050, partial [Candidatus Bathyarchaeia archaeon]|nr:hypothetical protein [Candidatus Bathyarchaeia archaeon]
LMLSLIALLILLYPQSITNQMTARYSYTITNQTYVLKKIFSLILPIKVNPSQSASIGIVTLVEGSLTTIQTTGCRLCTIGIVEHWNPNVHVLRLMGEGNVTFIAPGTGQYDILVTNPGSTPQVIRQLTINTNIPYTSQVTTIGNYTNAQNGSSVFASPIIGLTLVVVAIISTILLLMTLPERRRRRH